MADNAVGSKVTRIEGRLGEKAFWEAIKSYTNQFWGRSVTTRDFQAALEKSSDVDLQAFFDQWVY